MAQEQEVLQRVFGLFQRARHLRLVLMQPRHRFLIGVHGVQRMHLRVADDAQRMRARTQWNQPEPVTRPTHVIGGAPAVRRRAACQPLRIVRPLVGIDETIDAPPHRVHVVVVGFGQVQLALDQAGASGGVHHPARSQLPGFARVFEAHAVRCVLRIQVDLAHRSTVDEIHAQGAGLFTQEVLEAAAIQLPRRRRQQFADAQFGAAVDVVAAFGEEEAEAELADLLGFQVFAEAQHVGEIVRADFHRRFADLERGFTHRVRAPFQHGDPHGGVTLLQLDGQGQAGQAATHDQDIGGG